jgi:acyl-CoA thioester hydrolase
MIGTEDECPAGTPDDGREDRSVTFRGTVDAWECDQMGHLNVSFYGRCFSMADKWVFRGLPHGGSGIRVAGERIAFSAELRYGTPISIRSYRSSSGPSPILHHELYDDACGRPSASIAIAYDFDDGSNRAASSIIERALARLPLRSGAVEAPGGTRRRVQRKGRPYAVLTGRRVLLETDDGFADVDRETLIHLANQAVPNLGLDAYRLRDPDGHLSIGSATIGLTVARHRRARAGEAISVYSRVAELGRRSLGLVHDVCGDGGTAIARMEATLVFIEMKTRRSLPLPPDLVADHDVLEPGEPTSAKASGGPTP